MEDFVTYEIAKKLKEKGYPMEEIPTGGIDNRNFPILYDLPKEHPNWQDCKAWWVPTISQVLKWLREKNIYCLPFFEQGVDMWFYAICKPACGSEFPEFVSESDYDTYELAALSGIEYILDNLI